MKVYVVVWPEYDGVVVEAIFSDKLLADAYLKEARHLAASVCIQEYELNPPLRKAIPTWSVWYIISTGELITYKWWDWDKEPEEVGPSIQDAAFHKAYDAVNARSSVSRERAIELMSEHRDVILRKIGQSPAAG